MGILELIGTSNEVTVLISVIGISGSLLAAHLSYAIYSHNRVSNRWLSIPLGFILIVIHWFLEFPISSGDLSAKGVQRIVDVFIGSLYIWGFWSMKKEMERVSRAQKRADDKIVFMNSA